MMKSILRQALDQKTDRGAIGQLMPRNYERHFYGLAVNRIVPLG